MDKKEAIAHLEELKNDFNEYVSIETNIKDVQALEVALEVLKKIDNKVATQENSKQITILIDGKEIAKKMPVQEQLIDIRQRVQSIQWCLTIHSVTIAIIMLLNMLFG